MSGFAFRPPPGPRPDTGLLDWLVHRQGRTAQAPISGGVATGDIWPGLPITEFIGGGNPLGNSVAQATSVAQVTGFSVESEANVAGPPFFFADDDWVEPAPYAIAGMTALFARMRSGAMVSVPCDASGVRPFQPVVWDFAANQLVPAGDGPALPVRVLHVSTASVIQLFATIFVRWSAAMAGVAVILI